MTAKKSNSDTYNKNRGHRT